MGHQGGQQRTLSVCSPIFHSMASERLSAMPPSQTLQFRPMTSAQTTTHRKGVSGAVMSQHRFPAVCQKIIAELAFVRPEKPIEYLKEYLKDPEGAVPLHF